MNGSSLAGTGTHMTQAIIALVLVWYAFNILMPGRTR